MQLEHETEKPILFVFVSPDGFLLKKLIVALIIEVNMRLCKFIDDVVHTDINKADSARTDIITESVSIENTTTQVCLDKITHGFTISDESIVVDVLLLAGIECLDVRKK